MTKSCPKCGKILPDDAKFCMDCGYTLDGQTNSSASSSKFPVPMLFMALIIIILVIGGIFIITSSLGGSNDSSNSDAVTENSHIVDLTITDVSGWATEGDIDSKDSYTLYTDAIFNSVPDDVKGYNVKTTYYDDKDAEIGHETQTLDEVYYDSSYPLTVGFYTAYKKPNPDHVTVEIIKNGKVIDKFTEKIDKNKIDFLN